MRLGHVRLLVLVLATITSSVCGCATTGAAPAPAACAAPFVGVGPATTVPGGTVVVTGHGITGSCRDTGGTDRYEATRDVPVVLEQGRRREELGRAVVSDGSPLSLRVVVPEDVEPGEAELHVGGVGTLRLTVAEPPLTSDRRQEPDPIRGR